MTKSKPDDGLGQMLTVAAIGSYVINFGHLEHTVMRLIEWLAGSNTPGAVSTSTVRLNWSQLVERLRADAAGSPVEAEVTALLDEHHVDLLARLRHSLVHGSVKVSQPPGISIVRRMRDGSTPILLGSREQIEQECQHVVDLGAGLDRLLPETFRRVSSNLVAGVVGLTRERAIAQGLDPDRHIDEQLAHEPVDLQDETEADE
jgi:hypothetical protein